MNLERCKASAPEPTAVTPVEPPAPEPARVDDPPVVVESRRGPDGLGLGLTIGGAVLAGTGAALFGSAFARQHSAQDERRVDDFERGIRGANAQYWAGVALLSAGGAILIGGIVRLALASRTSRAGNRRPR